ncbi:cell wall hydrolase [Lachnoclostridium sp. An181]|uniref:cell wall hydrolase n=1 Tax=Lachnoclostridium sp. An181 TaxID=1965575 RepID=UPI000B3A8093|nr:cell wall hydrolase [Lachnoclostridium sp. An181]OUP50412.1 hypothetical protein B5F18_04335 [Lachnoclostridium sp. An181]
MKENKKVLACALLSGCLVFTAVLPSSAAATQSEALTNTSINNEGKALLSVVMDKIPEAAAIAEETQEWHQKAVANVDVQADVHVSMHEDSEVVGRIYHNTIVEVADKGTVWSKIVSGNVTGYVQNSALAFGQDAVARAEAVCPEVATAQDKTELREEPNAKGEVKGYASAEKQYKVVETESGEDEQNGFIRIQDENQAQFYVPAESVTVTRPSQTAKTMEQIRAEEEAKKKAEEEKRRAEEAAKRAEEAKKAGATSPAMSASASDEELLAALIYCEAGGEPYEGQVAVGAVVLNRVRSGKFPNSIRGVIYQAGQFGPAVTGKLERVLASGRTTDSARRAAAEALAGVNPIGDALYFGNGNTGYRIGGHYFH